MAPINNMVMVHTMFLINRAATVHNDDDDIELVRSMDDIDALVPTPSNILPL